jgi:hypothetical protein
MPEKYRRPHNHERVEAVARPDRFTQPGLQGWRVVNNNSEIKVKTLTASET